MIDEKRVLAEFLELVQIRCSTHDEREVADLLTKRLQALGGTVHEDNAGENSAVTPEIWWLILPAQSTRLRLC
jgi:di/tripeptidase